MGVALSIEMHVQMLFALCVHVCPYDCVYYCCSYLRLAGTIHYNDFLTMMLGKKSSVLKL